MKRVIFVAYFSAIIATIYPSLINCLVISICRIVRVLFEMSSSVLLVLIILARLYQIFLLLCPHKSSILHYGGCFLLWFQTCFQVCPVNPSFNLDKLSIDCLKCNVSQNRNKIYIMRQNGCHFLIIICLVIQQQIILSSLTPSWSIGILFSLVVQTLLYGHLNLELLYPLRISCLFLTELSST